MSAPRETKHPTEDLRCTRCGSGEQFPPEHADWCPYHAKQLLTDALDFIADNEWAVFTCLDCGAPRDSQHSEKCRWLAIMRRAGRAR